MFGNLKSYFNTKFTDTWNFNISFAISFHESVDLYNFDIKITYHM